MSLELLKNDPGMLSVLANQASTQLSVPKPFSKPIMLFEDALVVNRDGKLPAPLCVGDELELRLIPHEEAAFEAVNKDGECMGRLITIHTEVLRNLLEAGKRCFASIAIDPEDAAFYYVDVFMDD